MAIITPDITTKHELKLCLDMISRVVTKSSSGSVGNGCIILGVG